MNEQPASRGFFTWKLTFQWVVGLLAAGLLAMLTFSRDGWIPWLSGVDLGIHELGHMLTSWAPTLMVQAAGSFLQVAVPVAFAIFFFVKKDRLAVILMVAWAAESLNNVSVYMYDATRMVLPLLGDDGSGDGHDWHNIFTRLGLLGHTDGIAYTTRGISIALFGLALGLAVWWWVSAWRSVRVPKKQTASIWASKRS